MGVVVLFSLLAAALVPALSAVIPRAPSLSAAAQTGTPPCPRAGFSPGGGIMWQSDADLARDLDEMVDVGAQWIRLDFGWASMEPSKGVYDWSNTDRVLKAVDSRGLKVVAIVHITPAWARAPGTDNIFYPPTDPADYANFANKVVSRYSGTVKVWEVMNEPNISIFWQPKPDPVAYTNLLKLAYPAIKKADPGATVLSAGLSPAVDEADGSRVAPANFLQKIYEGGGKGSFDAVGIHPYSYPARPVDPATEGYNTFHRLPIFYDLMVRNGDGDKKMWLTEYGSPTGTATHAVSEPEQAAMITAGFRGAAQMPGVGGPLFVYSGRDAGTNPNDPEDNFGVLRRDFSAKPSRAAFQQAAAACIPPQPPTLSIDDATVVEGNSGTTTPATFTITRSGDTSGTSSVRYETVAGTAIVSNDFVAVGPTTVNFAAGETSKAVAVAVNGDSGEAGVEDDETFSVKLSSPAGATISDNTGLGTILNDDAAPTFSINDVAVVEGNSGTTNATFTITRSGLTARGSALQYSTSDGTATAGGDYAAVGATVLDFGDGETSKTVTVAVKGDTAVEPAETFSVKLFAPFAATIADDTGVATILNDDWPNTFLSVDDLSVNEGALVLLGATATFTITRSGDTSGASSVRYATADGTATAGSDYTAVGPTTASFAAGETTKSVPVTILADLANEPNETVLLNLSSPVGAAITDSQGVATIVDDDILLGLLETPGPVTFFSINDVAVTEGNSGTTAATFTIARTGITTGASSVQYSTAAGTATAGSDFVGVGATTVNFAAGETVKTVTVAVNGDTVVEPPETFSVKLSSPSGGVVADDTGVATIVDDDAVPTLAISDAAVVEGNSGTRSAAFTITRSGTTALGSSVQYSTAAGTATAGSDFVAVGATTVNFAAGETAKTVTVAVNGDTVGEGVETFSVKLSSPTAAVISDDTGVATIFDDDAQPTVAVSDVVTPKGDTDGWAIFSVTRSGNTAGASSVKYATAAGTATEGTDYVGIAPTTLSFADQEKVKIVTVKVKAEAAGDETFSLNLSSPTAAAVSDGQGGAQLVPASTATAASSYPREDVVWTAGAGVTIDGNDLTKTTATGWANSGAASRQAIGSGDGFVELKATETNTYRMIGLSNGDSNQDFRDIDFAMYLTNSATIQVYEKGAYRGAFGPYAPGDVLSVEVKGGTVRYHRNGAELYRSTAQPVYPLLIDAALFSANATLRDVVISGELISSVPREDAVWIAPAGVTIDGNDLTKTTATGWGNSGAASRQAIGSGDGFVELRATETNTNRMIGLSNGDSNQDYRDIDFAMYLTNSATIQVYEKGAYRGAFGPYAPGDVLSVEVKGGTVRYHRNGAELYRSTAQPVYPLLIDAALFSANATLRDVVISGELG